MPLSLGAGGIMFSGCPSVRPSVLRLKYPHSTCTWVRLSIGPTVTVLRHVYMSVSVTESSIMPFYDHDDRTIIETDASSRWLPGLSLEALKLAFSASGDGWGGHPGRRIRFIDEIALHSYLLYTVFNTLRPRQDGCLFADDILKCIFLNGNS